MEPADLIDLSGLRMGAGEGRRLDLPVTLDAVRLSEQGYSPVPAQPEVRLDTPDARRRLALQLRFEGQHRRTVHALPEADGDLGLGRRP